MATVDRTAVIATCDELSDISCILSEGIAVAQEVAEKIVGHESQLGRAVFGVVRLMQLADDKLLRLEDSIARENLRREALQGEAP